MELIEGHVYTGTLPDNRNSPRQYAVIRISGSRLRLRYGWFGWLGKSDGPDDPWAWSPGGVFSASKFEFEVLADLGPSPDEGDPRKQFPWATKGVR